MKEKSPIQAVRDFLNSEPTDRQRNIILILTMGGTLACPFLCIAAKLLAK
jgi:hypothetical protein